MIRLENISLVAALVLGTTGPGFADSNHGHDVGATDQLAAPEMGASGVFGVGNSNMMGGDHHEKMMPMMHAMMQMHSGNTADARMGALRGTGMGMMDQDMMGMMLQDAMSDQPMDAMMRSSMGEFDGNSDSVLSLDEFESLHSAMFRDRMVDRFQHLDADGDGIVTEAELEDTGSRMDALRGMGTGNN